MRFPSTLSYEKPIIEELGNGVKIEGILDMNGTSYTSSNFDICKTYCGVIHMKDIILELDKDMYVWSLKSANVYLYIETFDYINQKRNPRWTQHRWMMDELNHWNKFKSLLEKVREKNGECKEFCDISTQTELWFGFSKRKNCWAPGSCTLNPWFNKDRYLTLEEKRNVLNTILKAGEYNSDSPQSKETMHNLVPRALWKVVFKKLMELTPPWSCVWNRGDAEKEVNEQCERLRRLFAIRSMASKYFLDIGGLDLGTGGRSTAEALATVFKEGKADLRWLAIGDNSFNLETMRIIGPAIKSLPKLEILAVDRLNIPFHIFVREDIDGLVLWAGKKGLDFLTYFREHKQGNLRKCLHIFISDPFGGRLNGRRLNGDMPREMFLHLHPPMSLFDFRFTFASKKTSLRRMIE